MKKQRRRFGFKKLLILHVLFALNRVPPFHSTPLQSLSTDATQHEKDYYYLAFLQHSDYAMFSRYIYIYMFLSFLNC